MTSDDLDLEREPVAVLLGLGRSAAPTSIAPAAPAPSAPLPERDQLDEALEAILMVADEPQPLVTLASGVQRPVAEVRRAVQRLSADYDGADGGVRRGFEL